jgi:hypothetical protein
MLTARESSIGSSGGTTEVTIMMQCSTSLLQAPGWYVLVQCRTQERYIAVTVGHSKKLGQRRLYN